MNRLSRERSPYLLQHAHNPVEWFAWSDEAFAKARSGEQADLSVDRLLDLPLVPRDGARVVRERGGGRGAQRPFRVDQGRSRRTARRRSRLHDLRSGDDRIRRLADERLADAGPEAVLWRHLLPADVAVGPARVRRHPPGDRPRLDGRPRPGAALGRGDDDAVATGGADGRDRDRARRRGAGARRDAILGGVRLAP